MEAGKYVWIVTTERNSIYNGQYLFRVNTGPGEEAAREIGEKSYRVAVINPGESYVGQNGKWYDWSEYSDGLFPEGMVFDNFSIKMYVADT